MFQHESDLTLILWQNWLYKRVFLMPAMKIGISVLDLGRAPQHSNSNEEVVFCILDGQGHYIHGNDELPFASGSTFHVGPGQVYTFDCDDTTSVLTARCLPDLAPDLHVHRLAPGQSSHVVRDSSILQRENEILYVQTGNCRVSIGYEQFSLRRGTFFWLPVEGDYLIENPLKTELNCIRSSLVARVADEFIKAEEA